jgi:hypothetical protein
VPPLCVRREASRSRWQALQHPCTAWPRMPYGCFHACVQAGTLRQCLGRVGFGAAAPGALARAVGPCRGPACCAAECSSPPWCWPVTTWAPLCWCQAVCIGALLLLAAWGAAGHGLCWSQLVTPQRASTARLPARGQRVVCSRPALSRTCAQLLEIWLRSSCHAALMHPGRAGRCAGRFVRCPLQCCSSSSSSSSSQHRSGHAPLSVLVVVRTSVGRAAFYL